MGFGMRRGVRSMVMALGIVVIASACVAPPPPPPRGTIVGRVVHAVSGSPLAGVTVEVLAGSATAVAASTTTASGSNAGRFTIANVPTGTYRVRFRLGSAVSYWPQAATFDAASDVVVTEGAATDLGDATLTGGYGQLLGAVTNAHTGDRLNGVAVAVIRTSDGQTVASDTTRRLCIPFCGDGRYHFPSLPSDTYRVRFGGDGNWAMEYWNDATSYATASDIVVAVGSVVGADAALADLRLSHCPAPTSLVPGADFTGADLHNCYLAGRDLTGVTFTGANLQGASFFLTRVSQWPFGPPTTEVYDESVTAGARIDGADLRNTLILDEQLLATDPDWSDADLSLVHADGELDYHDFAAAGADLRGTKFGSMNLSFSSVAGLDLTDAEFVHSDLRGVNLAGAVMSGTVITGSNLEFANPTRAQLLSSDHDWRDVDLRDTSADLRAVDFAGSGFLLSGINLSGVDLTGSSFASRDLTGATLNSVASGTTDLTNVDLTSATIRGTDFSGAVGLTGSQLLTAQRDWRGTHLTDTGADLSGVDFATGGWSLNGAKLVGINLAGSNLAGSDLSDTALSLSDLTGADLTNATVVRAYISSPVGLTRSQLLSTRRDWTDITLTHMPLDLAGVDFKAGGWTLRDAKLHVDLTGANLGQMNLSGANFFTANLTQANLLQAVGSPYGAQAIYSDTVCPDGTVADGSTVPDCRGHGMS